MNRYHTNGLRSVLAEDNKAAANIFANRMARKHYGRKGYCRTLRLDNWSANGQAFTYEAFIGYTSDLNQTTGHNVCLTLTTKK